MTLGQENGGRRRVLRPDGLRSGWSSSPGGPLTHWKAPPYHGARQQRTLKNVRPWSSFIYDHDLAAYGGVVGGRMWTLHQEAVRDMKAAFGI